MNVSLFYAIQNSETIEEITVPVKVKLRGVYDIIAQLIELSEYATALRNSTSNRYNQIYRKNFMMQRRESSKYSRTYKFNKERKLEFVSLSEYLEQVSLVSS